MTGKEKVDLQIRGVIEILEDNVDDPESLNAWLDEVMSYPPVSSLKPGEPTAMIRAMRDAIDRV